MSQRSSDSGATGSWSPRLPDELKDAHDPAGLIGLRERFSLAEAVRVLSHYDLGEIDRVREFRRGSRRSPKLRIASVEGDYLLKRRAPGRDDRARIAFVHHLQQGLGELGYPVAALRPSRQGTTMVELDDRCYELFEFIESSGYRPTPESAASAGGALARLHNLVPQLSLPSEFRRQSCGSFHGAHVMEQALDQVPAAVTAVETDIDAGEVRRTARLLRKGYVEAARRAERTGFSALPTIINHGDWHPGNLLFRDHEVAAVIDFDSARPEPRVVDLANGLLQFTMFMGEPADPASWPEGFDGRRIEAFLRGYDEGRGSHSPPLEKAELESLPWLMVEAIIVESVVPIAATGTFATIRGSVFLQMVERKVDWIWRRSERLARLLES